MHMDDANPNIHKPNPTKPSPANTRVLISIVICINIMLFTIIIGILISMISCVDMYSSISFVIS